jgi:hypothetical protein
MATEADAAHIDPKIRRRLSLLWDRIEIVPPDRFLTMREAADELGFRWAHTAKSWMMLRWLVPALVPQGRELGVTRDSVDAGRAWLARASWPRRLHRALMASPFLP